MLYSSSKFSTLTLSQMGDVSDVSSLLATHKPHIVVDEDGGKLLYHLGDRASSFSVGCIIYGEDDAIGSPLNQSRDKNCTSSFVTNLSHSEGGGR